MFKLIKNPTFTHDVPIMVPIDGGYDERPLKVRYRALHADDLAQHDLTSIEGQEAYLRAIVAGFPAVIDDDGTALPDDPALFDQLVGMTFIRTALIRGYGEAMTKARIKN